MASVNKWIGIGNLGRDPETRTFPSGDTVCNISIACTDKWRDKQTGENKERTEWVRISFHGRLAEIADQYLRKGSQVYVEGSLTTRKWQDKDGKDCYSTEIRAHQLQLLGNRSDGGDRQHDDRDRGGRDDRDRGRGQDRGGRNDRHENDDRQDRQRGQGGNDRGGSRGNDRGGYGSQRQGGGRDNDSQRQQASDNRQYGGGGGGGGGGGSGFDDMDDDLIPFLSNSMAFDMESKLDRRMRRARV